MDNKKEIRYCKHCKNNFEACANDFSWDNSNYSLAKVCICPICESCVILDYIEEENINFDNRYYMY